MQSYAEICRVCAKRRWRVKTVKSTNILEVLVVQRHENFDTRRYHVYWHLCPRASGGRSRRKTPITQAAARTMLGSGDSETSGRILEEWLWVSHQIWDVNKTARGDGYMLVSLCIWDAFEKSGFLCQNPYDFTFLCTYPNWIWRATYWRRSKTKFYPCVNALLV